MDFTKMEEIFDVADKISSTDIEEYKQGVIGEVIDTPDDKLNQDELTAKHMFESFQSAHEIFKNSLELSNKVLNKLHESLLVYEEEMTPEMVSSFASLQKNMMDSVKVITQSYKAMSEAKMNLEGNAPGKGSNTNIQTANIVIGKTTRDLLGSLKLKG